MLRALYSAATGMQAEETKIDVVSNNLANASTTGFKKVQANFEDLLSETLRTPSASESGSAGSPLGLQVGLGTQLSSTSSNMLQGAMNNTNNPLDLAITGTGYFKVQQPNGDYAYTRAGSFQLNAQGQVVNPNGLPLEPAMTIPPQTTQINISAQGLVTATVAGRAEPQQVGQIEIVTFTNPGGLMAMGGTLFQESPSSGSPVTVKPGDQGSGQISQGYLEGSNVSAVDEMIDMIAAQRGYEMNSKIIETADDMLQDVTNLKTS